jgi:23S rRNA (cytosine1962-C5)-methyltransferase
VEQTVKDRNSISSSNVPYYLSVATSSSSSSLDEGNEGLELISAGSEQEETTCTTKNYRALLSAIQDATLSNDAGRVFHGRGNMFPGCEHLTLDWFPPVWLLTSHNVEVSNEDLELFSSALECRWSKLSGDSPLNWVYQCRSDTTSTTVMAGSVPDPHVVTEHGVQFVVRLLHAQNHGIFLDMANGREWVQKNAKQQKPTVLNLFAYTCGFSLAALAGGATEVVNIDMAKGPLKIGQRNHDLNGLQENARFLPHDVFKTWGKIRKLGPYGMIVVDPPSFQRNSFVAKKDYGKVLRRLPSLLTPNNTGLVLLCLNAPELDTAWLQELVAEEAPELEFVERLANPESFPSIDPEKALKVLVYRRLPEAPP